MINLNKELKILYVHGFAGHSNGNSAQLLRNTLKQRNIKAVVDAPGIPYMNPQEAVNLVKSAKDYNLIIASSLGAFYTLNNVGTPKILVNIAMPNDLLKIIPDIDKEYLKELNTIKDNYFEHGVNELIKYETNFLFGTKDNIAQNKEFITNNFRCYDNKNIHTVDMDHHLDETGVNAICGLIIQLSLCGNRNLQLDEELIYED